MREEPEERERVRFPKHTNTVVCMPKLSQHNRSRASRAPQRSNWRGNAKWIEKLMNESRQ
jgi:hypothetical protein